LIEVGLITARFMHFAAVMALFGLALFPLYAHRSSAAGSRARLGGWLNAWLWGAALLGLLSALGWGWFTIVNVVGSPSAAADPDNFLTVMREMRFGQVWVARLLLVGALLALLARRSNGSHHADWAIILVTGLFLLSLAFIGHTQSHDGPLGVIHVSADAVHLLAAGAWFGGLLALGHLLMLARRRPSPVHHADATAALTHFSGMGYIAVAALIGSGLINAWMLVGSPGKLVTTRYGELLLLKLCLLVGMLALAALNRFRIVPSLLAGQEGTRSAALPLFWLQRNVIGEQVLGLGVILVVAYLGTMQPAIVASE
jgi:copper resistance protein D